MLSIRGGPTNGKWGLHNKPMKRIGIITHCYQITLIDDHIELTVACPVMNAKPAILLRRLLRAVHPSTARIAWWAVIALRSTRARSQSGRPDRLELPGPGVAVQNRDTGIVARVLKVGRASCLERSLVLQSWYAHLGRDTELVIGVATDDGFHAHAWLAGTEPESTERFSEIMRIPSGASKGEKL